MTDYVEILDTQIEPDAPLTAVLAGQWRDNPIAIAEGSPGAPKVASRALQGFLLPTIQFTTTPAGYTNLGNFSEFLIYGLLPGAVGEMRIRFTNNNGSTWGAAQALFDLGFGPFFIRLNIVTGQVRNVPRLLTGVGEITSVALPSGTTNGFQLLTTSGAASQACAIVTGGR